MPKQSIQISDDDERAKDFTRGRLTMKNKNKK